MKHYYANININNMTSKIVKIKKNRYRLILFNRIHQMKISTTSKKHQLH